VSCSGNRLRVSWEAEWFDEPPTIEVRVPNTELIQVEEGAQFVELETAAAGANVE
jgi:hypothetical protein